MNTVTDALPISKKDLLNLMNAFIPKGMIAWFDLEEAPEGWEIYTPLLGKYPLGANTSIGAEVEAGLPNINGRTIADDSEVSGNYADGAFYYGDAKGGAYSYSTTGTSYWMYFDASRSNSIYGNSTTVTPPSVNLLPCIKL